MSQTLEEFACMRMHIPYEFFPPSPCSVTGCKGQATHFLCGSCPPDWKQKNLHPKRIRCSSSTRTHILSWAVCDDCLAMLLLIGGRR